MLLSNINIPTYKGIGLDDVEIIINEFAGRMRIKIKDGNKTIETECHFEDLQRAWDIIKRGQQCENQEMEIKKRDFDCNTCSWFENGRCVNLNRSAYYPCPEWLRCFDPENIPAIKHGRIWGENIIQT